MSSFGALIAKYLALAIAVAGSAITVVAIRTPQLPEPPPIVVMASAPEFGWVGEPVPVTAAATANSPVERFELWVDGSLTTTVEVDDQGEFVGTTFDWVGTEAGWSSLRVRAYDEGGEYGQSKPLDVQLVAPSGRLIEEPGTVDEAADRLGVPLEALLEHNPGLAADGFVPGGTWLFLPGTPLPPDSADPSEPEESADPPEGPTFEDGVLTVGTRFDGVFVYLTQEGVSHRIPDDPAKTLRVTGRAGRVDLQPHLPPIDQGEVEVEVWGRKNGVHLLGRLVIPAHLLWEPVTTLHAMIGTPMIGGPFPALSMNATVKDIIQMKWSANFPHDGVAWFLANTQPSPAGTVKPWGVYQKGQVMGNGGEFAIDLTKNSEPKAVPDTGIASGPQVVVGLPPTTGPSTTTSAPTLGELSDLVKLVPPGAAWAWVVPIDEDGHPVGPPSPPVQIVMGPAPYDPMDAPPFDVVSVKLELPPAPNEELAQCVRIVREYPPFPYKTSGSFYLFLDGHTTPTGGGGTIINGTLPYTLNEAKVAVYPFTACPGETRDFKFGDGSCEWNFICHFNKAGKEIAETAIAAAEFLADLAGKVTEAYNGLKTWAIEQVAAHFCPSEVEGPCKTMIQIGVDALLATAGVPPTLPEFDDLADAAKGEIVDLALDQIGVGSACDAVAGAVTQKTCGDIATQLGNMDACAFAPKGQEDNCQELVSLAQDACGEPFDEQVCKSLTTDARDLVEQGFGAVIDESIEAMEQTITETSLASLGFASHWMWSSKEPGHGCKWGKPPTFDVQCPDILVAKAVFSGEPPPGCHLDQFSPYSPKPYQCVNPPREIEAIPEPYGQYQPIRVSVMVERNDNPMPAGFSCGPLTAEVAMSNQYGTQQPYLPATAQLPTDLASGQKRVIYFTLGDPNPLVALKKTPTLQDLADWLGGKAAPEPTFQDVAGLFSSSNWQRFLAAGTWGGARISGECIPEPDVQFLLTGQVPGPRPRMIPGAPQ